MRICNKCNEEKPLEDFYTDNKRKDKKTLRCKQCIKEHTQKWYYNSPVYRRNVRNSSLMKKFGIKHDYYEKLSEEQNHVCAICGGKENSYKKFLHIDHNHETGEIRGLLCRNCNNGLGCFKDNKDYLKQAIEYLS